MMKFCARICIWLLGTVYAGTQLQAATIEVTSFDGPGCNFIEAVKATEADSAGTGPCAASVSGTFGDDEILLTSDQPYIAQAVFPSTSDYSIPFIRDNLTVRGRGKIKSIIRAESAPDLRLFELVSGARLTLYNLHISNFKVTSGTFAQGAVIRGQGDLIVKVYDSVMEDNFSILSGGAIRLFGPSDSEKAVLIVERSAFISNSSRNSANNVREAGGAIELQNFFNLSVRNSTFYNNHAEICGALRWHGNSNDIELVHNTFSGNYADGFAGAICGTSRDGFGKFWFANNIVTGNFVNQSGKSEIYFSYTGNNYTKKILNNIIGSNEATMLHGVDFRLPIIDGENGNILGFSDASSPLSVAELLRPISSKQGVPHFPLVEQSPAIDAAIDGAFILDTSNPAAAINRWHAGCRGITGTLAPGFDVNPDQLGQKRPIGGACDIGAIEYEEESQCYVIKADNGNVITFCL